MSVPQWPDRDSWLLLPSGFRRPGHPLRRWTPASSPNPTRFSLSISLCRCKPSCLGPERSPNSPPPGLIVHPSLHDNTRHWRQTRLSGTRGLSLDLYTDGMAFNSKRTEPDGKFSEYFCSKLRLPRRVVVPNDPALLEISISSKTQSTTELSQAWGRERSNLASMTF